MIKSRKSYDLSEEQLIEECRKNNPKAQRALYDRYAKRMTAVCLRYCGDYETARDLMHDAFVKLFNNLDSYQGNGPFEGWVRRIFINTSLEYLRKNDLMRNASNIDEEFQLETNEPSILQQLSAQDILNLIQQLPTGFRLVFNLYAIEGYSHTEIGQMLGINEASSRSQFSRARQQLQKMIQQQNK